LFAFLYMLAWTPNFVLLVMGLVVPDEMARSHVGLLVIASGAYGFYRVLAFHPIVRPAYYKWLRTTPWSRRQPLPFGPVHLVPQDLVVILIIMALGIKIPHLNLMVIPLTFLVCYLVSLCSVLVDTKIYRHAYVLAFGLGLMGRFLHHDMAMLIVAIVLYVIGYLGLQRSLARYPWVSDTDRKDTMDLGLFPTGYSLEEIITLRARRQVGWPYEPMKLHRTEPLISYEHGILISLLVGWFVYIIIISIPVKSDDKEITSVLFQFLPLLCGVAMRTVIYCIGYSPPISIWGRIFTFRWIIPGYDKVFVASLVAVIASLILHFVLPLLGVPIEVTTALIVSAVLMILLNAGPTLGRWRLTGHHRIGTNSTNKNILARI
jgi:hypothetical protein